MKNIMKKVFVMLLAITLFLPVFSTVASAAEEKTPAEIWKEKRAAYVGDTASKVNKFTTLEERIHGNSTIGHMSLVLVKDGMALYNDSYSGEVIILKLVKAQAGEKQDKDGYKLQEHTCNEYCEEVCSKYCADFCAEHFEEACTEKTCLIYAYEGYWTSNPYDVSSSTQYTADKNAEGVATAAAIKENLYSQLVIKFTQESTEKTFFSFKDCSQYSQLTTKEIKGGLRVEYIMGRLNVKYLCPERIALDKWFELYKKLKEKDATTAKRFYAMYKLYSADLESELVANLKDENLKVDPLSDEFKTQHEASVSRGLAVCSTDATEVERKRIEENLREFYTIEELDQDHAEMNYVSPELESPVFRLALEYTLNEDGFSVRCNAANVRFNSEKYSLSNIMVLPYAGCGNVSYEGNVFSPDGSGTIYSFDKIASTAVSSSDKVYGQDYAFSTITGANKEAIRVPVFGIWENEEIKTSTSSEASSEETSEENGEESSEESSEDASEESSEDASEESSEESSEASSEETSEESSEESSEEASEESSEETSDDTSKEEVKKFKHGFFAIIEEGDSLANIIIERSGTTHNYVQAYTAFNPRPKDTYALNGGISAGTNALWTVEADRKYTGDFKLKVFILTEDECSYVGMAKIYRNYLIEKGVLTPVEDNSEDIPLYIETIGAIDSTDRFLGVPYEIKERITTYENVVSVLEQLSGEAQIKNVNIKLSGWVNGGVSSLVPSKVELVEELGGEEGFKKLVEYCNANGVGLFPEFEFTYATENELFDDFDIKEHTAKTIDNRNAFKKEYDPLKQGFSYSNKSIISANYMQYFYDLTYSDFAKYGIKNISAATLGSDLSSDFNKDDPLNREDAKDIIMELLSKIAEENEAVMLSGGNSYTWGYVDHITGLPLENTMYLYATASVPFLSLVLHGSVEYTGSAINLAGDTEAYLLKTIENGANPYFIIAYENASELKANNILTEYYSVRYSILKQSIVNIYGKLNSVLKYTKNHYMNTHEYIEGSNYKVVKVGYSKDVNADENDNDYIYYLNYTTEEYTISEDGVEQFTIEPLGFVLVDREGKIVEKGAVTNE